MTPVECESRVKEMQRKQLMAFWNLIQAGNAAGWEEGKAFEYFIIRAFELEGAAVRYPYMVKLDGSTIEQIDGALYVSHLSCLVESKDTVKPCDVLPIAKMRNQLLRRPAGVIGVLFSHADFTPAASQLATYTAPQSILLWNGEEIDFALKKKQLITGLMEKYRHCVEHGLPDYDIRDIKTDRR